MKTLRIVIALLCLALASGPLMAGEREDAAREAAVAWLALVDADDFDASWEAAGSLFQDRVDKASWAAQVESARGPLGAMKSRAMRSAYFQESLPGAPDGEYVIIQFQTAFENKTRGVETVTPMLEDGEWKVVGYFVK